MPEPAPEPKDRFHCIECLVQVVVGSEAKAQSAEVTWQLEHRLCTVCMHKRRKETPTRKCGTGRRPMSGHITDVDVGRPLHRPPAPRSHLRAPARS